MDPQIVHDQEQPPVTPVTPTFTEAPQLQPQVLQTPKKVSKKVLISTATIVGVAILALAGYFVYSYYHPATKTADVQQTTTPQTAQAVQAINPTLEAATAALTSSAQSETSIISTDNSSAASDASTAAGNVGDSINENNF